MTESRPRSFRSRFVLMNRLSQLLALATSWLLVRAGFHALFPFANVRGYLDQRAGDGSADLYTESIHRHAQALTASAVWLGFWLLMIGWLYRTQLRQFSGRVTSSLRAFCHTLGESLWTHKLVVGFILLISLGLRWPFLDLPMRFDESYTWLNYASAPLYVTVTKYDSPNNHILHSVLEWFSTRIFGNELWAIRLPALLCGLGTAGMTAWWGARRAGTWAGLVAGLLVACTSVLMEYSVNARGYTLQHLLFVTMFLLLDEWEHCPSKTSELLVAVLSALAMWTMPISLYGLIILAVSVTQRVLRRPAAERWADWKNWGLAACLAVGLTILLYLPVFIVWGVQSVAGAGQGGTAGFMDWGRQLADSMPGTVQLLFRDFWWPASAVLIPAILGFAMARATPSRRLLVGVILGGIVCLGVIGCQQIVPPPRTWLFLIPIVSGLVVNSLAEETKTLNQHHCWRCGGLLVLALVGAMVPAARCFREDSIPRSREAAKFDSAEAVIRSILPDLAPNEPVIAVTPASAPLAFYGRKLGLTDEHFFPPTPEHETKSAWLLTARAPDQPLSDVLKELNIEDIYRNHQVVQVSEWPEATVWRLLPKNGEIPEKTP